MCDRRSLSRRADGALSPRPRRTMGKGKKSKSGGPGPEVGECEAAVKAANEGHELVPVGEETLDAMEDRHRRERAAVEALCASLGQSKPEKDKRVKMMGWISQRQYEETRAWEDANEGGDEGGDASSDDDAHAADALAKDVSAKATVADADEPGAAAGQGGMTKAMKRRLKKEAEERERDARIEEEKANAGPSEREDEEKILRSRLQPLGHAIAEIKADGHCMYRSVEHQLAIRGDGGAVATDHVSLRRMTADRMRADEWDYRPFSEEFAEASAAADEGWAKHCDDVEKTAAWGGQLELGALAKALRRSIVVFSARMPAVTMGEEFASEGGTPLLVCYQRHAFGLGEHYNSIVDV